MNGLTPTDLWTLLIVAALTGIAAMLAMAETSLTRMSRARAMHLHAEQRRGAAQLLSLVEQPARFLNLVLLLLLVVQFTATALFTSVMDRVVGGGLGVAIDALVMTLITFIFAEVAPKTYAVQHTDRAALAIARVVYVLPRLPVLGPLTRLLIAIGNVVTPGKGLKSGPFVSEDEIKAMVDEAERDEVIEEEEREMIHSVFEFGDTILREVMVPRPDMVAAPRETSLQDVLELILRTGYSRIPVFDGTIDEVAGLAYAKDVLRRLHDGQADKPLADIVRPAQFTLKDLLEEIVGEIADEYDREEPNIEPLPDGDYRVNARLDVDEVNELLEVNLPSTEWDSIGGLLFNLVGGVPREGQEVELQGLRLRDERVQGRRSGRGRVHRLPPPEEAEDVTAQARREGRGRPAPRRG